IRLNLADWRRRLGPLVGSQHDTRISSLAFSPDGKTILSGASESAQLWDAVGGQALGPPLPHQGWLSRSPAAFTPDGKTALTPGEAGVLFWSAATGAPLPSPFGQPVQRVFFRPDGRTALTRGAGGRLQLWDATRFQPIGPALDEEVLESGGGLLPGNFTPFSPDGRLFLTRGNDGALHLRDAATGQILRGPLPAADDAAFSPDGRTLATAVGPTDREKGKFRLWATDTGEPRCEPIRFEGKAISLGFSPDGKAFWAHTDEGGVRLWDAVTGLPREATYLPPGKVRYATFSPDGKFVLTEGDDDMDRLWESRTGRLIRQFTPPTLRATFSRDGRLLLLGYRDGTARLV